MRQPVERRHHGCGRIEQLLGVRPIVAILDARQAGKTTLAPFRGLIVLNEIRNHLGLFPVLSVLADRPGTPAGFLVPGGASSDLLRQDSESLAGRIAFHELGGFALEDAGPANLT